MARRRPNTGPRYPNGFPKSRLLEVFLTYAHFGCSPEDYALDLEFIRREESIGSSICSWRQDFDGLLVVDSLNLTDPTLRIVVTKTSFLLSRKMQVFISYGREDAGAAEQLAEELDSNGYSAWLDKHDLRGGQRWKMAIRTAIRKSRFFIPVLSSRSVQRRGYVHREIREALEVLEEHPDTEVFVIPVRLDECRPAHVTLFELQWIDLFPDWHSGVKELIRSFEEALRPLDDA